MWYLLTTQQATPALNQIPPAQLPWPTTLSLSPIPIQLGAQSQEAAVSTAAPFVQLTLLQALR